MGAAVFFAIFHVLRVVGGGMALCTVGLRALPAQRNSPASNVSRGGVQQDRGNVADPHVQVVSGRSVQDAFKVLEGSGARRTRAFALSSHCTLTLPVIWIAGWPGASRREGVPWPRDRPARDYLLPEG